MTDAPDLKTCPFCGAEARFTYHNGSWPDSCHNVECANWKCPSRSGGRPSQEAAADLWNTRADLPTYAEVYAQAIEDAARIFAEHEIIKLRHYAPGGWRHTVYKAIRALRPEPGPDDTQAKLDEAVKALEGMLAHSCVADAGADMKDAEDHEAERLARIALAKIRGAE